MPKKAKPWFRKDRQKWVCRIDGKLVTLGDDEEEAHRIFKEIKANRGALDAFVTPVANLCAIYLKWCRENRAKATFDLHRHFLRSFVNHIGKSLLINSLDRGPVLEWSEQFESPTTQHDAISIVQRVFNWAVEQGKIKHSPIPKVPKPRRKRREVVYTPKQWKLIKSAATGAVIPLLDFLWSTGCRPLEARTLESRHVHDDLVIFPPDESKGERRARVIYLLDEARKILKDNWREDGPIFRNHNGKPWTKNALVLRCRRLSEKLEFRVIPYGARHSFATNALIEEVDTVSLSHLMGHADTRMVNNYAHLQGNTEFLKRQMKKARGKNS